MSIKRDYVIQPGEVLRIKGEGMPKHQSSEKGDLYVKVHVIFQTNLTEKQIESKKTFSFLALMHFNLFKLIIIINQYFVSLNFLSSM